MRVFRNSHTLGFAALLVFAMQLALVFADTHVHVAQLARTQDLAARAITYGMCRPDAERPCPAPVQHDDSKCQICSAISLAGAALVSVPAPLPALLRIAAPPTPPRAAALVHGAGGIHFHARAPPRVQA